MKKIICIITTVFIIFNIISFQTFAANEHTMASIADHTIHVSVSVNTDGTETRTYTNIDSFVSSVRQVLPQKTDREIAEFIMMYTGQPYENLVDEELLFVLDLNNITTSTTYFENTNTTIVDQRNNFASPLTKWNSNDGKMNISTNYSLVKTVGSNKYFLVWATATWLDFPLLRMTDVFALNSTGTYDDSYTPNANYKQQFMCDDCGKTTRLRIVTGDIISNDGAELKYKNVFPYIELNPIVAKCISCNKLAEDESFSAHIKYQIITTGPANIQAGYAHKTFGLSSIGVSLGIESFGFSASFGTYFDEYIAEAVTLI